METRHETKRTPVVCESSLGDRDMESSKEKPETNPQPRRIAIRNPKNGLITTVVRPTNRFLELKEPGAGDFRHFRTIN